MEGTAPLSGCRLPFTPYGVRRKGREDAPPGTRQAIVATHARRASDAAVVQNAAPEELPDLISP